MNKPDVNWDILYGVITVIVAGIFFKPLYNTTYDSLYYVLSAALIGIPALVVWSLINIPMLVRAIKIKKRKGIKKYLAIYFPLTMAGLIFDTWLLFGLLKHA